MSDEAITIQWDQGETVTNSDYWKMESLCDFLAWLLGKQQAAVRRAGADLDGEALGALVKEYVLHGPQSDEAAVRRLIEQEKALRGTAR